MGVILWYPISDRPPIQNTKFFLSKPYNYNLSGTTVSRKRPRPRGWRLYNFPLFLVSDILTHGINGLFIRCTYHATESIQYTILFTDNMMQLYCTCIRKELHAINFLPRRRCVETSYRKRSTLCFDSCKRASPVSDRQNLAFWVVANARIWLYDSLFQAFGWWGAGEKLGRRRKIDEGKNRAGRAPPLSPLVFFPSCFFLCWPRTI